MLVKSTNPTHSVDDVTVVIVTYFSAECIVPMANVLKNIKNIVFVDNGSTDNTVELIHANLAHAKVIALSVNIGFGAANNRGFSQVSTRYIAIVNPDIEFSIDALAKLLVTADQFPDAAFIAPQLVNKERKLDISYRYPRYLHGSATWKATPQAADALTCVGYASAAFLLARRDAIAALNGFDESFFLYYEDDDLCSRAFSARLQIIVDPNAVVTHFSRGSVKTKSSLKAEYFRAKHHTFSKLLFQRKHSLPRSIGMRTLTLIRLWTTALLALPIRLLIPSKKYAAYLGRVCGRLAGLFEHTTNRSK